jgi:hypothetical protein
LDQYNYSNTEKIKITATSLAAAIRVSTTAAATSVSAPLTAATSIAATKQKQKKILKNTKQLNKLNLNKFTLKQKF